MWLWIALIAVGLGLAGSTMAWRSRPAPEGLAEQELDKDQAWEIINTPLAEGAEERTRVRGRRRLSVVAAGLALVLVGSVGVLWSSRARLPELTRPPVAPLPTNPAPQPGLPPAAAPPKPAPVPVSLTIEPGASAGDVADRLVAAGLIKDKITFIDRLVARGADTQLKAGTHRVPPGTGVDQVIDILIAVP